MAYNLFFRSRTTEKLNNMKKVGKDDILKTIANAIDKNEILKVKIVRVAE